MKFPCEFINEIYLSQIRITAAKYLYKKKLSQKQISELIQVSQPVISGYLQKVDNFEGIELDIANEAATVGTKIGKKLFEKGNTGIPQSIEIGCNSCKVLRQGGNICRFHKQKISGLEDDCTCCQASKSVIKLQIDRNSVLRDLRETYNSLSSHDEFVKIIPEIGLQIIVGLKDKVRNINDIAGFPGRIINRKGISKAELPAFGSSERSGQLLLKLQQYLPNITALAGIKTSTWLFKKIEEKSIPYIEIDGFDQFYEEKLQELLRCNIEIPVIILDWGSIGYEPISYVLTNSCDELKIVLSSLF